MPVFTVLHAVVETYADPWDTTGQAEGGDCAEPERRDRERQKYRELSQVATKAAGRQAKARLASLDGNSLREFSEMIPRSLLF